MSDWKEAARGHQERWKSTTQTLPDEARAEGTCFEKTRGSGGQYTWHEQGPYTRCLPRAFATHNLLAGIRQEALARMDRFDIVWQGETPRAGVNGNEGPTSDLLGSQVQCINALMSLEAAPTALLSRIQTVVPGAYKLVPIRHTNQAKAEGLVAFEWIGRENYLKEKVRGARTQGCDSTGANALIVAEREGNHRTGVLVMWRFTEQADAPVEPISKATGADRRAHYRPHYEAADSPFSENRPPIDAFLHPPHYQLLRQSLLAQAMLRAKEHGVDQMVVLALVPRQHDALMNNVPPGLRSHGTTLDAVWGSLLPGPRVRFVWQDTQAWLTATPESTERYGGLFSG